jgi:hypothetical protein
MGKISLALSVLILAGLLSGCHYGTEDDDPAWGYYGHSDSYREGFRDGRAYERRRSGWGYSRYGERYGR